jgi:hypothetical protein
MRSILLATAAAALVGGLALSLPASAQSRTFQGSFQGSCRNVHTTNGVLTADCADGHGAYRTSSINSSQCRGDIGNSAGLLRCNGATAIGGNVVSTSNNRGQGGRLYGPGYAYPAYGQPGYGMPQTDPRYAQGGYAYGRATGQWMPIAQRVEWLNQRISRGAQEGTLDRGEVHSLRNDLTALQTMENRYRRQGMQGWQMADLDKRFDVLASRIQYERTDGDNGRNGRDERNDRRDYQNRNGR